MEYIECPNVYDGNLKTLFIAGGITGCSNWQETFVSLLIPLDIAIFNPRRANFPMTDPDASFAQIMWEHTHLAKADAISFWFCPETMNPIVLLELGLWMRNGKPIFIGADPQYQRIVDVVIQTKLERPELEVVYSLEALAEKVRKHFS